MNARVLEAIKKSAAVPSMPQVVTRFLEVIQSPDFDYDQVVKVLSSDAGTVSEILRLANSALFGLSRKVTSLRQALTLLGAKRTRSLVLGRALVEGMNNAPTGKLDTCYFWRRSLASSVLAARLADATNRRLRDEAFISALLADIGIAILAEALPDAYGPIAAAYAPGGAPVAEQDERDAVEITHGEVSAMVLGHWGLPETICNAVSLHQSLTVKPTDEAGQIARIIHASDRIAKLLSELPDADQASLICAEAMAFADIGVDVLVTVLGEIEGEIEELGSILKTDVIPSKVYSLIAKAIQEKLTPAST